MFRHDITRLPIPTRELVRDAIYLELKEFAEGGNHGIQGHGPIPVQWLYLSAAERLAGRPLNLIRPDGVERFTQMAHGQGGAPSVTFPNYGIDLRIASLLRITLWEAFLHGLLAPAPMSRPIYDENKNDTHNRVGGGQFLDLDYVVLTPDGVDVLLQYPRERIRAYDPAGYLESFSEPQTDFEMMRYINEGIVVLQSNHLLAAVVLLGIASERLVEVTAMAIRAAQASGHTVSTNKN